MKNLTLFIILVLFHQTGLMAQECTDTVKLSLVSSYEGPDLSVQILVENYDEIIGFQFGLNYDSDMFKLKLVSSSIPGFDAGNFTDNGKGNIRFLWIDPSSTGQTISNLSQLISLKFTPLQISSIGFMEISEKQLPFEFVNKNSDKLCVKADFKQITSQGFLVSGKIIHDKNKNCSADILEKGLSNWLVELTTSGKKYYRSTNDEGNYSFNLPNGIYSIRILPRNEFWQACDDVVTTVVSNADVTQIDFLANDFLDCPKIKADISTGNLKRCRDNIYNLVYENQGTIAAENVKITVNYEEQFMQLISIDYPDFVVENGKATINIGNLGINKIDTIKVILKLLCDNTVDGQTHCVTALATPNEPCIIPSDWSGAQLELKANCDESSRNVRFNISNIGTGDMKNSKSYIVTEDDVMRTTKPIKVDQFSVIDLEFPANGSTYRIFATQDDGFPYESTISTLAIEGCGKDGNGNFSKGFVNIFEESDRDLFIDKDCQQSSSDAIGNTITAFPAGYSQNHFIEKETNIEYMIRFQNNTTDTVNSVVIKNIIPNTLDISSLQLGSASHPYTYRFNQEKELVILFDNVLLPDKITNSFGSYGFIKYKIIPTSILKNGDSIKNTAKVILDYNSSMKTNEVFHIIETDFIISSIDWTDKPLDLKLFPNPVINALTIDTKSLDFKTATYEIYNTSGQVFSSGLIFKGVNDILCDHLPNGQYHIRLNIENEKAAIIKVIKL